jgi:para-nitrobenzyl esterase
MLTGDGTDRETLAQAMHRAWTAFAHRGDPSHAGAPPWPRYDLDRRATMRFDTACEVIDDPAGDDRKAFEALLQPGSAARA